MAMTSLIGLQRGVCVALASSCQWDCWVQAISLEGCERRATIQYEVRRSRT